MTKGPKFLFVCQSCGHQTAKWLGRCPDCGQWNSFVEEVTQRGTKAPPSFMMGQPQSIDSISLDPEMRLKTGIQEFDRTLGGGIVPGSMVLIGGHPGRGKSTLLLEVAGITAETVGKVLYVSGEESAHQIKLRADRLGLRGEGLFLLPETDLESIIERGKEIAPRLVIIDSIQTVHSGDLSSAAGSVGQVRE